MFFVYVLFNRSKDKIYIGQTGNLEKRLEDHNLKRGNHFTARFDGKWTLIYKEEAENRQTALLREKQLKSFKGREFLKQFITKD